MEEILDYTARWLKIALSSTEKMDGHAFFSEIPYKFPLRNTDINMDCVYYALCLIEKFGDKNTLSDKHISFVIEHKKGSKDYMSRVSKPFFTPDNFRDLLWNLYAALRSIDKQLAKYENSNS